MQVSLNNNEIQASLKWAEEHRCTVPRYGEKLVSWSFTQTGVGLYVKVLCPDCKESCDVTDYDNW